MPRNATKLETVFMHVAEHGDKLEDVASNILRILKARGIKSLDVFDTAVREAYDANGWHTRAGKPANGEEEREAVPTTVRNYVWEVRSAIREGVKVDKIETFYELRQARAKARAKKRERASASITAGVEELEGVNVAEPETPNGSLFHDMIVLFLGLPGERQHDFSREVSKLMHRFAVQAPAKKRGNGAKKTAFVGSPRRETVRA